MTMKCRKSLAREISRILIGVLVLQPVLFALSIAQPAYAQSTYNTGSTFDASGVSQFRNSDFLNSPEIGQALTSCLQVVPSFQNKILSLKKGKKKVLSGDLASFSVTKLDGTGSVCSSSSSLDRFSNPDTGGLSQEEYDTLTSSEKAGCTSDSNVSVSAITSLGASIVGDSSSQIEVKDSTTRALLENLQKTLSETNKKLDSTNSKVDTTNSKVSDTNTNLDQVKVRQECMDSIAYAATKQVLARTTEGVVNWIETGNFGDPFYIKDTEAFFKDINKQSIKTLFSGILENDTDYPFLKSTYKGLLSQSSDTPFADIAKSTLGNFLKGVKPVNYQYSQASSSSKTTNQLIEDYKKDFRVGGWEGWLALTQQDQNNPIGFSILAQTELAKKVNAKTEQAKNDILSGNGFLSMKKCTEQIIVHPADANNPEGWTETNTRNLGGVSANDPTCKKSEVVTPGSIIAERMKTFVGTDARQLELADSFNQSLNTIFTAAFNRLQTDGLASLSKKYYGDWSVAAAKQSVFENYTSKYTTTGSPSLPPAELIVNRPTATGYSSADFDITQDLFDQQVGCTTKKGIVSVEEDYLLQLKASTGRTSPLTQIIPAMAKLDFCIPGPTSDWENIADKNFETVYNTLAGKPIKFVAKTGQNADLKTYYNVLTNQIGQLNIQLTRDGKVADAAGVANMVAGLLVSAGVTALIAPPVGTIVAAGLLLTAGIFNIMAKKQAEATARRDAEEKAFLSDAENVFKGAVKDVWDVEALMWSDEQVKNMIADYKALKPLIFKKYSDANSIDVAKDARPFIGSLPTYAENTRSLIASYDQEIKDESVMLIELRSIRDAVKVIKDAATQRAKDQNISLELPLACRPKANQCPVVSSGIDATLLGPGTIATINNLTLEEKTLYPKKIGENTLGGAGGVSGGQIIEQNWDGSSPLSKITGLYYPKSGGCGLNIDSSSQALSVVLSGDKMTPSSLQIYGETSHVVDCPASGATETFTITGYDYISGKGVSQTCKLTENNGNGYSLTDCKTQ